MVFLATVDPSPRPQPMKFPVFSQLAGNFGDSETGSLETASSSGESSANRTCSIATPKLASDIGFPPAVNL